MFNEKNERNVFLINWSKMSNIDYYMVVKLMIDIARVIIKFITKLKDKFSISNANFDFIGFSMGV